MGALFDRSIHPLYAVMAFVSAAIVLLLLISGTNNRKEIKKNHKLIFIWVIFFCLQDGFWGLFASHIFYNDAGLFFMSNIFHLSAIFSAFAWTAYFLSRIKDETKHAKLYLSFAGIVALIQFGMVAVNLSSRFMFYVDEHGWYQTTDYRAIMFYLQFATYILIGIVSLIGTAREQKNSGRNLSDIFFVNLSPLLFGIFQLIYPDAPADSIGFAIGCVIIELFLSREYNEQVFSLEQTQEAYLKTLKEYVEAMPEGQEKIYFAPGENKEHSARLPQVETLDKKGYDVLLMDGELDVHQVSQLEQKNEKMRFVRIDSDIIENLIKKEDTAQDTYSTEQKEGLRKAFDAVLPKKDKLSYYVSFEAASADALPVFLTQNEFMRRMKEMSAHQQGMSFYGEMPDQYNLVVNTQHPLIQALAEKMTSEEVEEVVEKKDGEKQEGETPVQETVKKTVWTLSGEEEKLHQLVDIALLASGQLKGEALAKFVNRSVELL